MNRLRIDFGRRPRLPSAVGASLLCVGVVLVLVAAWEYQRTRDEAVKLAQQLDIARHVAAQQKQRVLQAAPKLSERSITAINQAISRLNLPWDDIFAAVETDLPKNVALLALEPDSRQWLRITAESKSPDDMADYIEALSAGKRLAEVTLVKHEINEQDPNRPIHFVLQARWGASR